MRSGLTLSRSPFIDPIAMNYRPLAICKCRDDGVAAEKSHFAPRLQKLFFSAHCAAQLVAVLAQLEFGHT